MNFSTRILLGLAFLLAAGPVAGQTVDHYELAPSVMRANGQSIYPSGVSDPSRVNPPGPPPESAVPVPPTPGAPVSAIPAGAPAATPAMGPPIWSPQGPASPSNSVPGTASAGAWNYPAAAPPQVNAPATAIPGPDKSTVASWYTRIDYFHWNERIGGSDFLNENGALFTLGYMRQIGIERFRAELFGGDVHYQSTDLGGSPPFTSNTGYLGVRGEYEMVLAPSVWEGRLAVLLGLGTRFWIRDLHDGSDDQGNLISGYQETWWTMYPYLGLETHRQLTPDLDLYSESRIGVTALTYQFATTAWTSADPTTLDVLVTERPLWPKPGVFANVEIGLRGPYFFLAARAEVMSWAQSSVVQDSFQPNSVMFTAGGRLGFMF